jgi:hypothetical protein
MPVYLGQDVTDDYLQGLLAAYRAGYEDVAGVGSSEDADQPILDRLAETEVQTDSAANVLGRADAHLAAKS